MPVGVRQKLRAVTKDVGGQARVARLLGVSPSRVSRWLKTEQPDAANIRKVEEVEFVISRLLGIYEKETALKFLEGFNSHLGNRRPIDLITQGRTLEILKAIEALETGSYS